MRIKFTLKDVLILLLSFIIAILIVIFTDIAEGETLARQNNFKKLSNQPFGDLSEGFHCQEKIFLLNL